MRIRHIHWEALTLSAKSLKYQPLERIAVKKPVHRVPWIARQVVNKNVLDLGAFDETALMKRGTGAWLHDALATTAKLVVGLDDSPSLPEQGVRTSPRSQIFRGDIMDLDKLHISESFDVIIAGEIIEHLVQPLHFLRSLTSNPKFSGTRLILSTPNATSCHNILMAIANRESQHRDHLHI